MLVLMSASALFADVPDRYPGCPLDEPIAQERGLPQGQSKYAPSEAKVAQGESDVSALEADLYCRLMLNQCVSILWRRVRDGRVHLRPEEAQAANDLVQLLRGARLAVCEDGMVLDREVHDGSMRKA